MSQLILELQADGLLPNDDFQIGPMTQDNENAFGLGISGGTIRRAYTHEGPKAEKYLDIYALLLEGFKSPMVPKVCSLTLKYNPPRLEVSVGDYEGLPIGSLQEFASSWYVPAGMLLDVFYGLCHVDCEFFIREWCVRFMMLDHIMIYTDGRFIIDVQGLLHSIPIATTDQTSTVRSAAFMQAYVRPASFPIAPAAAELDEEFVEHDQATREELMKAVARDGARLSRSKFATYLLSKWVLSALSKAMDPATIAFLAEHEGSTNHKIAFVEFMRPRLPELTKRHGEATQTLIECLAFGFDGEPELMDVGIVNRCVTESRAGSATVFVGFTIQKMMANFDSLIAVFPKLGNDDHFSLLAFCAKYEIREPVAIVMIMEGSFQRFYEKWIANNEALARCVKKLGEVLRGIKNANSPWNAAYIKYRRSSFSGEEIIRHLDINFSTILLPVYDRFLVSRDIRTREGLLKLVREDVKTKAGFMAVVKQRAIKDPNEEIKSTLYGLARDLCSS